MSEQARPFEIAIDDAVLSDLKHRLDNTRWPEAETVDDWTQGLPLDYAKTLVQYWANEYDWRAREARLNRFPQFKMNIDGLDIHFYHVRSPEPNARPLIMTHGWPGSVVEFQNVIGPLTDPVAHGGRAEDAFHLVCPSLPGYGFSDKPSRSGCNVKAIADMWNKLMLGLGYDKYYAQGGDWGSMVTTRIAVQHPDTCLGVHVNMAVVIPDPATLDNMEPMEQAAMDSMSYYNDWDSGYSSIQSTRPQTLGYGLADSPVAQLCWIVEKFHSWSDHNGHPEDVFDRDEMLDNVMLYWLNNTGASSARLYWESFKDVDMTSPTIPVAVSIFPKEIFLASKRWCEAHFDQLSYWNGLDKGGHFAAFERSETFIEEVRKGFNSMR